MRRSPPSGLSLRAAQLLKSGISLRPSLPQGGSVSMRSTDPSLTDNSRKSQHSILIYGGSFASGQDFSANRSLRLRSLWRTRILAGRGGASSPRLSSRDFARRPSDDEAA